MLLSETKFLQYLCFVGKNICKKFRHSNRNLYRLRENPGIYTRGISEIRIIFKRDSAINLVRIHDGGALSCIKNIMLKV